MQNEVRQLYLPWTLRNPVLTSIFHIDAEGKPLNDSTKPNPYASMINKNKEIKVNLLCKIFDNNENCPRIKIKPLNPNISFDDVDVIMY